MSEGSARELTALITGASSGIGWELAYLFARAGYNLVLVARSGERLAELAADLKSKHSVSARALVKDLSVPNAAREIYDELRSDGVRVDALVNNSGFGNFGKFAKTDLKNEQEMIAVNVVNLVEMTKLFLPGMLERKHGRILNVASTAGFQPGPYMAIYYASKAFVLSFTEAVAEENRGTGVTVTCLCPGVTKTNFHTRANIPVPKVPLGTSMDVKTVARIGFEAMLRGQTTVIPGLQNKLLTMVVRLSPRTQVVKLVRRIQEQREM
jgi:uncharacterized protein